MIFNLAAEAGCALRCEKGEDIAKNENIRMEKEQILAKVLKEIPRG